MKSAGYTTGIFGKWGLGNPGSSPFLIRWASMSFMWYNCQRQSHSFYPDHLWHNEEKVLFLKTRTMLARHIHKNLIHEQALGVHPGS